VVKKLGGVDEIECRICIPTHDIVQK